MPRRFKDRAEAGRSLAKRLQKYAHRRDVLVLALPRGGVPVAFEVGRALGAPIDVFVVRKLGTPGQRELAMGAIATGGVRVINEDVIRLMRIPEAVVDTVAAEEREEMERRERKYRGGRPTPYLRDRTLILVDDGLATGSTMHAAIAALRPQHPARIVVAIPVAPPSTLEEFANDADEVVCELAPEERFDGVGRWYADFSQTTDEEVRELLGRAYREETSTRESERAEEREWSPWRVPPGVSDVRNEGKIIPTQEIFRDEWARYFEEFSRRHQGWLVTVEMLGLDIGDQVQVRNLPLEGIIVETSDDGDEMTILAGDRADARIRHTICAPLRVWIKQNEQGADEAVEIESPAGAVIVRFRAVAVPELVNGILAEKAMV